MTDTIDIGDIFERLDECAMQHRAVAPLERQIWEEIEAAGLTGMTQHGGRYAGATILHELGVGWETIGAITGHRTATMVRQYTSKRRETSAAVERINERKR